jgi:2-oxoglutarate ferredoxin oxidoreductase subunit gamma
MKEIICAGFGGQGVLTSGLLIAYMAMENDYDVTWMPAYGPTMRGGKANATVKYDPNSVGSPIMENADILLAMNEPSLDYLEQSNNNAVVFVNSNAVPDNYNYPKGIDVVKINCVELAQELKNPKAQNIIMLGAIIKKCDLFDKEFAINKMKQFFEDKGKGKFNEKNVAAFEVGYNTVL